MSEGIILILIVKIFVLVMCICSFAVSCYMLNEALTDKMYCLVDKIYACCWLGLIIMFSALVFMSIIISIF